MHFKIPFRNVRTKTIAYQIPENEQKIDIINFLSFSFNIIKVI